MSNWSAVVCCGLLSLTALGLQRDGSDREVLRVQMLEIVNAEGQVVMQLEGNALGSALRMRAARAPSDAESRRAWGIELAADTRAQSRIVVGGNDEDGEPGPTFAFGLDGQPLAPWLTVLDQKGTKRVALRTRSDEHGVVPTLRVNASDGALAFESDDQSKRVVDVLRAKRIEVVSEERIPAIMLDAAGGLASIKLRSGIKGPSEKYACGLWTSVASDSALWLVDPLAPEDVRAAVAMGVTLGGRPSLVVSDRTGQKLLDVSPE